MNEKLEDIFASACVLTGAERAEYLDMACAGDADLRTQLEALLAAYDAKGGFLANPSLDSAADRATIAGAREHEGQQIDRYKLLEPIGEGGFGSVWMAEQREPVRRRVAIKIIKLGMDTKQVIARFEAERQALAMMDHPNIAKVLDAGSTETGRPYFVMEYIKGVPILEYCDTEKLDTKSRLDLFMKVCHAIQHAHQKGIIHRDIKPSNILITMHDGVPVPKVIDFGIAKATNQELTERTLFTQHRQMIGTPAYMSPEQAEMSGLDIDTRSDVYSLGVLLYELLTGTTPFDSDSLMHAGFAEMMRIIREETPHKPSTRLSSLGETGTRTAEQRRTDLQRLGTLLRGDLDWIVMKCLEKDRTRRYETANGLAADIQRHLSDEPVSAGPPSKGYKLRKFVKRNRGQVIAGVVVVAALILGVIGTSAGMAWALRERNRADTEATNATLAAQAEEAAKLAAQENEQKAKDETERAERELGRATEIKRLIIDMLTSVTPEEARGQDTTLLRKILDDTAARLDKGEIKDELIAAELHQVIGRAYNSLGLYPQSLDHFKASLDISSRLLGEDAGPTLAAMIAVGNAYGDLDQYAQAEPIVVKALEISKRMYGDEGQNTLTCMMNLAMVRARQGRVAEGVPLLTQALEIQMRLLGAEHPATLRSMHNLAVAYEWLGRFAEAEQMYTSAFEIQKRVLGPEHPETLGVMTDLSSFYANEGKYDKAQPLARQALEIEKRVLGPEHPVTLLAMAGLGRMYTEMGRYEDAVAVLESNLSVIRRVCGAQSDVTLYALDGLGAAYMNLGRRDDAVPVYREWLSAQTADADNPGANADTLNAAAQEVLNIGIEELCEPARALRFAQRACKAEEAANGENLWTYLDTLALAQHMTGDTPAAVETQKRAISLMPSPDADPEMHDRLAEYEAASGLPGGDDR